MLEADDLHAGYGPVPVLTGASLHVARGERVVIIGRNGVGKTALLRTLMGHLACRRGRIRYDTADITHWPAHRRVRRGLALVPQGRAIFPALTVRENLRMGGLGASGGRAARLAELLERFPRLRERLGQRAGSLSGGEQQILAIARALMGDPEVLLLDEPTEGIQPSIVDEILEQLLAINHRLGVTMLLVEQNLDFAREFAQRAYTMLKGRITEELAPDGLEDPRVVAEYLGV
jgi:branched-chain amino acid transport system ATP-binding protein